MKKWWNNLLNQVNCNKNMAWKLLDRYKDCQRELIALSSYIGKIY